jgi:hypothetical protein
MTHMAGSAIAPYTVRERPLALIALLGTAALGAVAGGAAVWLADAPLVARVGVTAAAVLLLGVAVVFSTLTLRVDGEGLRVTWGGVVWKRLRPEEIARVEVGPYTPWRFGGWGWRFAAGGDQAFSYPGSAGALIVHRTNGRRLVVTLRDPAAAAAAVSAMASAAPVAAP